MILPKDTMVFPLFAEILKVTINDWNSIYFVTASKVIDKMRAGKPLGEWGRIQAGKVPR